MAIRRKNPPFNEKDINVPGQGWMRTPGTGVPGDIDDALKCNNCSCRWFVQEQAQQFPEDHMTIPGQRIQPHAKSPAFTVLRCVKCGDCILPFVNTGS